jgi:hypothetical protein
MTFLSGTLGKDLTIGQGQETAGNRGAASSRLGEDQTGKLDLAGGGRVPGPGALCRETQRSTEVDQRRLLRGNSVVKAETHRSIQRPGCPQAESSYSEGAKPLRRTFSLIVLGFMNCGR